MNLTQIWKKSEENLKAARLCLKEKCYNASANRSYYAAIQSMSCWLLDNNLLPTDPNHSKIINLFRQQAKRASPKIAKNIYSLYSLRQEADYSDHNITRKEASEAYTQASEFMNQIKQFLKIR